MRTLFATTAFILITATQLVGQAIAPPRPPRRPVEPQTTVYLVTFAPGTPASVKAAAVQASGARLRRAYTATNAASVEVPDASALARLRNDPRILGVFANQVFHLEQGRGGSGSGAGNGKPKPPESLTAFAASPTQIDITWSDVSTNEDGFAIERCLGAGCTNFTEVFRTAPNVVTFANSGLSAQTLYRYRVLSFNAAGNSKYSNIAEATTPAPPPPPTPVAPTNLVTSATAHNQVQLSWSDNSTDENGFGIERCTGPSASCTTFVQIAQAGANITGLNDLGVTGSTTYTYRVRAFNDNGPSAYSNTSQVTTPAVPPPPPSPPSAPTNLVTSAMAYNQAELSWSDTSNDESGFQIERCTGPSASCVTFVQIAQVGANITGLSDLGVIGSTTYTYRVRAFNNDGPSAYSNSSQLTTPAAPPPPPPSAPTNLVTTAMAHNQVELSWSDNSNDETGFQIERCTGAGCTTFVQIAQAGANITGLSDLGVTGSTTYIYRVRSFSDNGPSAYSNTSQVTTPAVPPPPPSPPSAPTNLVTSALVYNQVDLSWSDTSNDESGFQIERCAGASAGCTTFVQIAQVGANITSLSDLGVTGSTTYTYRVWAFNNDGPSAFSNSSQVTTPAAPPPPPPSAPTNLVTSAIAHNQVDLSWSDNSNDETGFHVERCTGAGCTTFVQIAQPGVNVTGISDLSVTGSTTYTYRVRSFSDNGPSAYSNTSQVTTPAVPPPPPSPPSAPTNLVTSAMAYNRVDLSWSDTSNDESGFQIERCAGASAGCTTFVQVAQVGANITGVSDPGVSGSTTYTYRVRAFNNDGPSAYSNSSQVTTPAAPPPPPPSAPSNLNVSALSFNQVELTWSDNSNDETGFEIERCTGPSATCATFAQIAQVSADTTGLSDLGVTGQTTYTYRVRAFNSNGQSAYSSPAQVTTPLTPPSSQIVPSGVERIGAAPGALNWTGTGVGVAVVDTGLDFAHADLQLQPEIPNVNSFNAFQPGTTCQDIHGHGTHVAGIIGAKDNLIDVVGVAPNATIYCVNVFQPDPVEGVAATDESVIDGLEWVLAHANVVTPHIRVVNLSLGREKVFGDDNPNHPLRVIVRALRDAGISVVVAAGNDPTSEVINQVPAFYPEVMAVASTTAQEGFNGYDDLFGPCIGAQPVKGDTASYFTTDGRFVSGTGVTISAPGGDREDIYDFEGACYLEPIGILSLLAGGGTTELSGTSMASPHVAGVVALMWEKEMSLGLNLAPETARARIRNNAIRRGTAPLDSLLDEYTFDGEREGVIWAPSALLDAPPPPVDAPPTVTIVSPSNNASFATGAVIAFSATATDPEDGNIAASLHWTSDRDGQIGTGGSFNRTLSNGNHVITASLVDSGGNARSASVAISVGSASTPTSVHVASVTFSPQGTTLFYTIKLVNEFGGPVAGASVRASLYEWVYTGWLWFTNGFTDAQGNVRFQLNNFDYGCYTVAAENVVAPGLTWIRGTPDNNYCRL